MSGLPISPKAASATIEDCAKLMFTLRSEYIPGLRIELRVEAAEGHSPTVFLELVDYSDALTPGSVERTVWSTRPFRSALNSICLGQLFDLLIVGYRVIDEFFATGNDNRPRPAKG